MAMTERSVFFLLSVLYMQLLTLDVVSSFPTFRWKARLKCPLYPPPPAMFSVTHRPALLQLPMCTMPCHAILTKSEGIQVKNSSAKGLFSAILCSCKQLLWHSWRGEAAAEEQDHAAGGGKEKQMPTSCGTMNSAPISTFGAMGVILFLLKTIGLTKGMKEVVFSSQLPGAPKLLVAFSLWESFAVLIVLQLVN